MLELDTIICGDCLKIMDKIPTSSIDLVFYDPPYNKQKAYDAYTDDMPQAEYLEWQTHVFNVARRVSKRGVCVFVCQSLLRDFMQIMPDAKLIIVHKRAAGKKHGASGIMMQWHALFTTARAVPQLQGHHIKDLWECRLPGEGYLFKEERTINPGQTSIALIKEVLRAFTLQGEIVLDPFMGCGSTAIAAIEMGRRFLGIDISEHYCNIARERACTAQQQPRFL